MVEFDVAAKTLLYHPNRLLTVKQIILNLILLLLYLLFQFSQSLVHLVHDGVATVWVVVFDAGKALFEVLEAAQDVGIIQRRGLGRHRRVLLGSWDRCHQAQPALLHIDAHAIANREAAISGTDMVLHLTLDLRRDRAPTLIYDLVEFYEVFVLDAKFLDHFLKLLM